MNGNVWEGKRVRLRAIVEEDWEFHFEWDKDTEQARRSYWTGFPGTKEGIQEWIEKQKEKQRQSKSHDQNLCIETLDTQQMVGSINGQETDLRMGVFSFGLGIRKEFARHGYAYDAVCVLLRFYFMELRYQKVNSGVYSFNEPSIKLHEKLGFMQEGRIRRNVYTQGAYHDEIRYGMTHEEFIELHSDYLQDY